MNLEFGANESDNILYRAYLQLCLYSLCVISMRGNSVHCHVGYLNSYDGGFDDGDGD